MFWILQCLILHSRKIFKYCLEFSEFSLYFRVLQHSNQPRGEIFAYKKTKIITYACFNIRINDGKSLRMLSLVSRCWHLWLDMVKKISVSSRACEMNALNSPFDEMMSWNTSLQRALLVDTVDLETATVFQMACCLYALKILHRMAANKREWKLRYIVLCFCESYEK